MMDRFIVFWAAGLAGLCAGGSPAQQLTLEIKDLVTMPMTGAVDGPRESSLLARVNDMVEEPGGKGRFFVVDMTGPLYIFDKKTNKLSPYLDLNGRPDHSGIFHKLRPDLFSQGFVSVQFDPDYPHNGKFYTIHVEDPAAPASNLPDNTNFPGLKVAGYTTTPAIPAPGMVQVSRECVLVEWTDTNISNTTFEGTAREILRVQINRAQHPLDDMIFNPTARPGGSEWRVMYVSCGDGGSGESVDEKTRLNPQRLDTMVGKIWRIIPDPAEHTGSSAISENGRYRIPNDNPFVNTPGARKEIWAYGLRNPNRLSWDADPADAANNQLIADVVGLNTWETVIIVHKGANYGYSLREGHEQLNADNKTSPLPDVDKIPLRISDTRTEGEVIPAYPVIEYAHVPGGGDAVSSGCVYRGKAFPALQGKYIFGDITTGRIWWASFQEMLAADHDKNHKTTARMHEISILWDRPGGARELYPTMAGITLAGYRARGSTKPDLPGFARVSGGRADIHLAMDSAGGLYIYSRSDGMIREVLGVTSK